MGWEDLGVTRSQQGIHPARWGEGGQASNCSSAGRGEASRAHKPFAAAGWPVGAGVSPIFLMRKQVQIEEETCPGSLGLPDLLPPRRVSFHCSPKPGTALLEATEATPPGGNGSHPVFSLPQPPEGNAGMPAPRVGRLGYELPEGPWPTPPVAGDKISWVCGKTAAFV